MRRKKNGRERLTAIAFVRLRQDMLDDLDRIAELEMSIAPASSAR